MPSPFRPVHVVCLVQADTYQRRRSLSDIGGCGQRVEAAAVVSRSTVSSPPVGSLKSCSPPTAHLAGRRVRIQCGIVTLNTVQTILRRPEGDGLFRILKG